MFTSIKKFFGRSGEKRPEVAATSPFAQQPSRRVSVPQASQGNYSNHAIERDTAPAAHAAQQLATGALSLPLRSVISRLPQELIGRVRVMDVGEAEVFVPMQKVLSQLALGAVRISFGELRQVSPPGTFSPENDRDRVLVDLPLQEILARVNPSLLPRRPGQKAVEVPPEVPGPFGGQTQVSIASPKSNGTVPAARPTNGDTSVLRRNQVPPVAPAPPVARVVSTSATPPQARAVKPSAPPTVPPAQEAFTQPIFQRATTPASAAPSVYSNNLPAGASAPAASRVPPPGTPVRRNPAPDLPPALQRKSAPVTPPPAAPAPAYPRAGSDTTVFPRPAVPATTPPVASPGSPRVYSPIAPDPDPEPAPIPFAEPESLPTPLELLETQPIPLAPPAPVAMPTPPEDPEPIRFNPTFVPPPTPVPVAKAAPVEPEETIFLNVPLESLSEAWPEPVRQEISALGVESASAALPQGLIESAMKQGRVVFPWKQVRGWIRPVIETIYASPHDEVGLELPLKVVTPAFLSSLRAVRAQRKVSIDPNIPDLFSGGAPAAPVAVAPAPVAPPAAKLGPVPTPLPPGTVPVPAAQPAPPPPVRPAPAAGKPVPPVSQDTNYYDRNGNSVPDEEPAPPVKQGPSPGTTFLQRYATPNEIVSKAAALNGVGGALIALPDGLMVASKIPPEFNADTLAAFLPQIFGRVSQSTRELRMGELNNLNFTVGLVPWKIFRVGAIYFAAFGISGQPLPTAQLAAIAAELDRKAK